MNRVCFSLSVLFFAGIVSGAVFRVPSEAPTVQAALDTIAVGDTILVAPGRYQEALVAPALPFLLMGDVDPDSASLPVISPVGLAGADTLDCLFLPRQSFATVQDIRFVHNNPSQAAGGMGINSNALFLTLRRCVIDSTRRGLFTCCTGGGDAVDSVFDCLFRYNLLHGINALDHAVIAERCTFQNSRGTHHALVGDGSRIRACQFDGSASFAALVMNGDPMELSACTFTSENLVGTSILQFVQGLGQVYVRNNSFTANTVRTAVIRARGGVANSYWIEQNFFENCHVGRNGGCIQLYTQDQFDPDHGGTLRSNRFLNCLAEDGGSNFIDCDADAVIENNRFEEWGADPYGQPAVSVVNGEHTTLQNNDFIGTGYALFTSADALNAENNWWGDNSGPYHETLNPAGLGDSIVGTPVDFTPWANDTITTAKKAPALPLVFSFVAFPNPFNNTITIEFVATKNEHLSLEIFDLTGRHVATVADEEFSIGIHHRVWNADEQASGIYFARLSSPESTQRAWLEKLVLLK